MLFGTSIHGQKFSCSLGGDKEQAQHSKRSELTQMFLLTKIKIEANYQNLQSNAEATTEW